MVEEQTFQMIIHEPEFKPLDITYLSELLPIEIVYYLLFECLDTRFGDYSFHDHVFNMCSPDEYGISADERATLEATLMKMGEYLYGYILIHPNLHPLLTSTITEVFQLQDTPAIIVEGYYDVDSKRYPYISSPEYYGFLSHLVQPEVFYNVGVSRNIEIANRSFGIYRTAC